MQLGDALREKQLRLLRRGRDREAHAPHALHEIGTLARPLVEGFAVVRMSLEHLLFAVTDRLLGKRRHGQADGENRGNSSQTTKVQLSQIHKGGEFFTISQRWQRICDAA